MLLDEADEVRRRIPRKGGLVKMRIGGEVVLRPAIQICEIAPAAAGDQNFAADSPRCVRGRPRDDRVCWPRLRT